MKKRRPPLMLGMTTVAATMTLGSMVHAAWASSEPTSHAEKKEATPPPATRMGAMVSDEIAKRDAQKKAQARALELREQAAKAAQARLTKALKTAETKADTDEKGAAGAPQGKSPKDKSGEEEPDRIDTLARIYQAMKPAKAAPVFEQLDLDVQTQVAQKMRERSTALIMGAMTPQAAAKLTMALAGKRQQESKKPATAATKAE